MIDFSVYLITDRHQVAPGQSLLSVVEEALFSGVKAIQLREKDLSAEELLPLATEMRQLTARYNSKLFINHHVELAMSINADGVHLSEKSIPAADARQKIGPDKLIGVSTHSKDEIYEAARQGADFVTFGPVYATPSKAIYGPPQGLSALAEACQASPLPVFALGGIKPQNVTEVMNSGASGIALISAIIASPVPGNAARSFMT